MKYSHRSLETRRDIYFAATPIILANAATPLLGLVDTAVLGHFGSTSELAGLAIANVLFNLIFWSFGFLRMSTTGFVAQAQHKGAREVSIIFNRAIVIAISIALLLICLQTPLAYFAFKLFSADNQTEVVAQQYFLIRIWGAPASLIFYSVCGLLIGLAKRRLLLAFQVLLNLLNGFLNILFVVHFELGLEGLAWATILSEYIVVFISLFYAFRYLNVGVSFSSSYWKALFSRSDCFQFLRTNRDLFIRTLFLLASFFWFTNQSAKLGDSVLAANQLLLAVISFSAFFLDGFAFVAEAEIGKAVGEKDALRFKSVVKLTSEAAAITAFLLGIIIFTFSPEIISALTDIPNVIETSTRLAPYAALYIMLSFAAFQLDGIFIASTASRDMRNASIISFSAFIACYYLLTYINSTNGLWLSFIVYVVFRALCLAFHYPKLIKMFQK